MKFIYSPQNLKNPSNSFWHYFLKLQKVLEIFQILWPSQDIRTYLLFKIWDKKQSSFILWFLWPSQNILISIMLIWFFNNWQGLILTYLALLLALKGQRSKKFSTKGVTSDIWRSREGETLRNVVFLCEKYTLLLYQGSVLFFH